MSDKSRIPTEEEIAQLPRWAIVAFAARCARRIQPLFTLSWPDAPKIHVQAIDYAITIAEIAAANAVTNAVMADDAANDAKEATNAAEAATDAANNVSVIIAAKAATYSAATATYSDAVKAATYAANTAYAAGYVHTILIRRDFDILKETADREHWTDKTLVPQKVFGPMWPEGKPEGWPDSGEVRFYEQPLLEIYIEPGNASEETIQAVFEAISDWHIAAGGLGLEFSSDGYFTQATESVPRGLS